MKSTPKSCGLRQFVGGAVIASASLLANPGFAQAPQTTQQILDYMGPDREQILLEHAKKEGTLIWYTDHTQYDVLAKAFEDQHPGIKVQPLRGSNVGLRLQQEYMANQHLADVYEETLAQVLILVQDTPQIFREYKSPFREKIRPELVQPLWTGTRSVFTGLGYNPNLVSTADVPKTYDDLLDPRWKGKIALSTTEPGVRIIGTIIETKGKDFAKKLGEQLVVQTATGRAVTDEVIAGEFAMNLSGASSHAFVEQQKGTPFLWQPLEPVPAVWAGVLLPKDAPHPFAAQLFVDWLLDPNGGGKVYHDLGNGSPVADAALLPLKMDHPDFKWVDVTSYPNFDQKFEEWNNFIDQEIVHH